MDTRQVNKVLMYRRVQRLCEKQEHEVAIRHIPGFQQDSKAFVQIMEPIQEVTGVVLSVMTSGVSGDKAVLRTKMAEQAAKIGAATVNLGKSIQDQVLIHEGAVTKSDLLNGRDLEAAAKVDALLKLANVHKGELGRYGVTERRLNDLDKLCEQFSAKIGRPREMILQRKGANQSLPDLMAKADELLEKMDRMMPMLEEDHPSFVTDFRNSRRLVNTAATRSLSEAQLTNAEARLAARNESRELKATAKAQAKAEKEQKQAERKARYERLKLELSGNGADAAAAEPSVVALPSNGDAPARPAATPEAAALNG